MFREGSLVKSMDNTFIIYWMNIKLMKHYVSIHAGSSTIKFVYRTKDDLEEARSNVSIYMVHNVDVNSTLVSGT